MWTQKKAKAKRKGKRIFFVFFWGSAHARAQTGSEVQRQQRPAIRIFFLLNQTWASPSAWEQTCSAPGRAVALERRGALRSSDLCPWAIGAAFCFLFLFFFTEFQSDLIWWRTRIQPPVYREEERDQRSTQRIRNSKRRCRKERGS
jgi:hypothetical protein